MYFITASQIRCHRPALDLCGRRRRGTRRREHHCEVMSDDKATEPDSLISSWRSSHSDSKPLHPELLPAPDWSIWMGLELSGGGTLLVKTSLMVMFTGKRQEDQWMIKRSVLVCIWTEMLRLIVSLNTALTWQMSALCLWFKELIHPFFRSASLSCFYIWW